MFYRHNTFQTRSGFTLIEVLVSLLIFSIGLIGMAGLVVMSVRTNHTAYLRTQATFLAESMAERMRINRIGVWQGNYHLNGASTNIPSGATVGLPAPASCSATAANGGCTPASVANNDLNLFSTQLSTFLPRPATATNAAVISCSRTLTYTVPIFTANPPYDGVCTITINWHEQTNSATADQTLSWVFQP